MKPFRPPARGFSLIEMVAAFLVFAISMGILMQILATSMRNTRQSSDYTMAALWAQSKLDTVGVGTPIEPGRSSGRFDDVYGWELDIQQVDPASVEPPPQAAAPMPGNAQQGRPGTPQNQQTMSAGNAGLGGGLQAAPFDLYRVDLTVFWGGRFGAKLRTAHFGTLRATNPDPTGTGQPGGLPAPRFGGGQR